MAIMAPAQWFPTPLTVTLDSLAPAILPKMVSVETAGSVEEPARKVCSKSFDHPLGVLGVPPAVVEFVDSMMM
jgi:hypothetical protein